MNEQTETVERESASTIPFILMALLFAVLSALIHWGEGLQVALAKM